MNYINQIELVRKKRIKISSNVFNSEIATNNAIVELFDENKLSVREELIAIFLDNSHKMLDYCQISTGSDVACVVPIKQICCAAVLTNAKSVILAHNHPGGSLKPSKQDISSHIRLKMALDIVGSRLLDCLILNPDGEFCSFMSDVVTKEDPYTWD